MGFIKKLLLSIFIILIILGGLYVYSLSKVEVRKVYVNNLQDVSLSGFTLSGNIELYNGGVLPIGIDYISYEVILESSNTKLVTGHIDGKLIYPKQITIFPFVNKINWVPTLEVALKLITPGKTYAKIKGVIYVADLKVVDFKIPFEMRIDLEQYIKQFVRNKVKDVINVVTDTVSNVVDKIGDGIKSITGKVVDGLGKLFG